MWGCDAFLCHRGFQYHILSYRLVITWIIKRRHTELGKCDIVKDMGNFTGFATFQLSSDRPFLCIWYSLKFCQAAIFGHLGLIIVCLQTLKLGPRRLVFGFWRGWTTQHILRCHNKNWLIEILPHTPWNFTIKCTNQCLNSNLHAGANIEKQIYDVTVKFMGEELTGCSYADQYRGQVKGPCCRADEHSDVPTRQKAWRASTPACLSFSSSLYLIVMTVFTCKLGHSKA